MGGAVTGPSWRCYRCGLHFVYARFLVTHLVELRGEGGAR